MIPKLSPLATQSIEYAISILNQHCQYDDEDGSAESDARDGLQLVLLENKGAKIA